MKRILLPLIFMAFGLSACNLLDTEPGAQISPKDYFRTETDLQMFSNTFYNNLLDKTPYDEQSDHYIGNNIPDRLRGGESRVVPNTGGGWSWGDLRKMNTLLGNIHQCEDSLVRVKYTALTRFFRAYFYFDKVKRFGDVPWIDRELETNSPELYKPRDSREFVMTKMLEDVDFAIENLTESVSTYRVNKWAALALKAQFCLYEGTFRKYHGITYEEHDYNYYLNSAAEAARKIMESGKYSLATDYLHLFADPDANPLEYILAIRNDAGIPVFNNSTAFATMPTQGRSSLTKKFVDSFLMKDGTRFTDIPGWETLQFKDEVAGRDPRLAYCMVTPGYKRIGGTDVLSPDLGCAVTGYQIGKYVMDVTLPLVGRVDMSYNDMPVYRLAEVYLIYAEALAEAGTLTQEDLDISVNKLRKRVGMPDMNLADANANPDPYLTSSEYGYRNVSGSNLGVILEIRRERSVEMAQEARRWDDLMRWKEGLCINQNMYGMYFPGTGEYDLSGDGVADVCLYVGDKPKSSVPGIAYYKISDKNSEGLVLSDGDKGYIDFYKNVTHVFNESRDYLYPIPITDRSLNPQLKQNPGWNDGLDLQ